MLVLPTPAIKERCEFCAVAVATQSRTSAAAKMCRALFIFVSKTAKPQMPAFHWPGIFELRCYLDRDNSSLFRPEAVVEATTRNVENDAQDE